MATPFDEIPMGPQPAPMLGEEPIAEAPVAEEPPAPPMEPADIVKVLQAYDAEGEEARKSGHSARDLVWEANWMLFWNIFSEEGKADWQSRDVMPEAPQFISRWASALREALVQSGEIYTVQDPAAKYGGFTREVKIILDYWMDRVGETEYGQPIGLDAVFEDLMLLGAISAFCAAVTWKVVDEQKLETVMDPGANGGAPQARLVMTPTKRGRVAVEPVDPRTVWFDPTGRRLYRRRRIEMDLYELRALAELTDAEGKPLYHADAIKRISESYAATDRDMEKEISSGTSQKTSAQGRKPVVVDEYLCAIVRPDGTLAWPRNTLVMKANDREIIRGPEPNPFWHQRDWIVYVPLERVPLAPYGKSYVEDWGHVARTFNEMTRLILDATFSSAMNAFAADANAFEDPTELEEGVHPNKVYQVAEGQDPTKVIAEIEMGRLPAESIQVWQGLKQELREGAKLSEIALGQLPPKGDITATEISESKQSSSSVVRSVAYTVEQGGLDVILELSWFTGLQHMDLNQEPVLMKTLGPLGEIIARLPKPMLHRLLGRPYQFKARGISSVLDRAKDRNALLAALGVVVSNPTMLQAFLKKYDEGKVMDRLMRLYGVDTTGLEREAGAPVPPAMTGEGGSTETPLPAQAGPAIAGQVLGGAPR